MPVLVCPRCGGMWQIKPAYGNFYMSCDCPPPITHTTNSTAGARYKMEFGCVKGITGDVLGKQSS